MKFESPLQRKFAWAQVCASALVSITLAVLFGWVLVPKLITWQISMRMAISPDVNPELYSAWVEPPVPIHLKLYLFNCTNPDEVENGALPAFQELGPYVFQESRKKINIVLDDLNDTATYKEEISYHFDRKLSNNRSLDDAVTLINVPFTGAAVQIARDFPWPLNDVGLMILSNYDEPLFVNKTVEEILFKGWRVPFLEKIEEAIGLTMLPENTFSFFMGMNSSVQGPYTIKRGRHGDKNLYARVIKYKNKSSLNVWANGPDSYCNQIYGTDGSIYAPFVEKDTILKFFNAEICRSAYLTFNEETAFEGIHAYRFKAPQEVSQEEYNNSKCFCGKDTSVVKCLRGVGDMGSCRDGAPVAMSSPHFYGPGDHVDAEYLAMTQGGWKADKGKHETYVDVQPLLGVIVRASKKLQINLVLKKVKQIKVMRNVRNLVFPLFWADESVALDPKTTKRLKSILFLIQAADYGAKFLGILVAFLVPIIILYRSIIRKGNSCKIRINHDKHSYKASSSSQSSDADKNELASSLLLESNGKKP